MRKLFLFIFLVLIFFYFFGTIFMILTNIANAEEISVTATVPPHTIPTLVGKVKNNYGSQLETYNPQYVQPKN
jgi:bacteriorhodopsin